MTYKSSKFFTNRPILKFHSIAPYEVGRSGSSNMHATTQWATTTVDPGQLVGEGGGVRKEPTHPGKSVPGLTVATTMTHFFHFQAYPTHDLYSSAHSGVSDSECST